VIGAAQATGWEPVTSGTLVVIDGPRFSTRAESRWYAAQGWTLIGMTGHPEAALARELARTGIRVNCVAPGLVDTPLLAQVTEGNEKLMAAIVRSIPLGRVGRPEDVARVILFLASDDAAYMTGQTVSVDGGLTMI